MEKLKIGEICKSKSEIKIGLKNLDRMERLMDV